MVSSLISYFVINQTAGFGWHQLNFQAIPATMQGIKGERCVIFNANGFNSDIFDQIELTIKL